MKNRLNNLLLLLGVVALAVVPLLIVSPQGEEDVFTGADGQAEELITRIQPHYKPWFASLWEPPSAEVESLLFALQAALGAGVLGYYFGFKRGQSAKPQAVGAHASH